MVLLSNRIPTLFRKEIKGNIYDFERILNKQQIVKRTFYKNGHKIDHVCIIHRMLSSLKHR